MFVHQHLNIPVPEQVMPEAMENLVMENIKPVSAQKVILGMQLRENVYYPVQTNVP